ncbi:MAG: DUF1016 domain-containing protein [Bacteroidetes bacterium]|nr:DUF1016 domain-containing protein [Bacteroidota bacterium]
MATNSTLITKFFLELNSGFAYIGRQIPVNVGGSDFIINLLFFHLPLRCYVVIELRNSRFLPEYAGKLGFYLSAIDSLLQPGQDNPAVGLIICTDKDNIVVEYELSNLFPERLKGNLPTIEAITTAIFRPKTEPR